MIEASPDTTTSTVELLVAWRSSLGATTGGGNKPQADNKQETISVAENGTFPVRNGRTNVSFTVSPLSTLNCPGNQVVVIESLTWHLTLSGEGLSIPIQGAA